MDTQKKKAAPVMGNGSDLNVQLGGQNKPKSSTYKPATKAEVSIEAFLKLGSLNTFEANREYNDTCLHSCVSYLNLTHGLVFASQFEDVGAKRPVKRYTPADIQEMKRVLQKLRVARGAEGGYE